MYMDGARRIIGVAQDVALARDQWNMCQETIHGCPDLEAEWGKVRNVNGDEWFEAAGCRYAIKAANRRAGRGGSNDEVNIDELREQTDWKAWGAVSKTTMAKARGQVWAMSNAGDDESVVLNALRDTGLSRSDPSMCLLEWSGEDNCELGDRKAWAQANPGLGYIIAESSIASAMHTDTPAVFRTEVLCQRVDQLDGAIDLAAWKDCADPAGTMRGLRFAACFDVAPDSQHATLAIAAPLDDGRVRVEIAGAWTSTDRARIELPRLLEEGKPAAFAWYPAGPAAGLAPILRAAALKYNRHPGKREIGELPEDGTLAGGKVPEVCQGLADLALARQVVHSDDPLLNAHVSGARKLTSGDGWRFTRRGGGAAGHVDAAYAAAGAVNAALTLPAPRRARIRLLG
jgi:phage terminase large subunit-like protein